MSRESAKKAWETRRKRYGPSGGNTSSKGRWTPTQAQRERIGAASRGREMSAESRLAISEAQQGPGNSNWANAPSYRAAHSRVERAAGPASDHECLTCGKQAQHWANLTGEFRDLTDYVPMCVRCHKKFDKERK